MIQTSALKHTYKDSHAIQWPDLKIGSNEQWLLLGQSGTGKTTLLHLLAGILSAKEGVIRMAGQELNGLGQAKLDHYRGKNVGMIFQKHLFVGGVRMLDNLLLAQSLPGLKKDKSYIKKLALAFELERLINKKPNELSQGELQRFSVMRSLVNKPSVLLADEPTSSLDDENCHRFVKLLRKACHDYHLTMLIATHDARLKQEFTNIIQL